LIRPGAGRTICAFAVPIADARQKIIWIPFNSVMFEFVSPEGGVPASKGTVPVCAAALIANAAMQIAAAILLCIVFLILS
jgi:hypothetical protein